MADQEPLPVVSAAVSAVCTGRTSLFEVTCISRVVIEVQQVLFSKRVLLCLMKWFLYLLTRSEKNNCLEISCPLCLSLRIIMERIGNYPIKTYQAVGSISR